MRGKSLQESLAAALMGALGALVIVWMAYVPETVTRAEMVSYVRETATEHLRFLRVDINEMRQTLNDIKVKVTTIEAGLIGRESDGQ